MNIIVKKTAAHDATCFYTHFKYLAFHFFAYASSDTNEPKTGDRNRSIKCITSDKDSPVWFIVLWKYRQRT